jgi:two-component system response regulator RegA
VLIVDDDETILSSCKRSLKAKDRQVYTTGDPAKACQMTRTLKPDAAIVDLRLGEVSGLDLIRDLKRLHPDIQIALLSGYLSVTVTMAAVKAGAEVVLSKPMGAREIVRHIEDGTSPEPDIHETPTLERVQWEHVSRVMADTNHNNTEAAKLLGIDRTTLQRWLRRKSPRKGR